MEVGNPQGLKEKEAVLESIQKAQIGSNVIYL
jgi:hypothetical protein